VDTVYDGPGLAVLEVRTDAGMRAARSGAGLVREAVLTAAARGTRTVWATLDVSTPVCGIALGELHDLAGHGLGDLRVRRVGGSILVDFQLADPREPAVVAPGVEGAANVATPELVGPAHL
jgi:hypothetical protein